MNIVNIPILLGIAYAVVAALLLNLNLASAWRREIKLAAIILVSGLYIVAYLATQDLRGWAIATPPPNPFKLHWAIVEEPDKATHAEGAIYILAQELSAQNALLGAPRLYRLPFSPALAEQMDEARKQIEDGTPLVGNLSYKAAHPDTDRALEQRDGRKRDLAQAEDNETPHFEFRALSPPALPPKAALQ